MPFATEIRPVSGRLTESAAELLALPVRSGADGPVGPDAAAAGLESGLPAPVADLLAHYELSGKPGESAEFPVDLGSGLVRVVLLGIGDAGPAALRKAGASLARLAKGRTAAAITAELLPDGADPVALAAFAEGALLAGYTFTLASSPKKPAPAGTIEIRTGDSGTERLGVLQEQVRRGTVLARATALARDLINTQSGRKDPAWLAEQAAAAAAEAGLSVSTWDENDLVADGFGAILAVGQGSARPPRLVRLEYTPADPSGHVVLVGKGITFDTGGLSLKPNDNMKLMKTDMSGAAIVIGVMSALAELGCAVRVTALLAIAENAFSGSAQRPGDVITTYGGRTVEVLNTDAEGRLVMADAIAYAVERLAPDALVDVATLTGAAKLALGTGIGALYSTDDGLAAALGAAGDASGERLWRMPLTEDYVASTKSRVADLANIGTSPEFGRPGATEAALFLREFVGSVPWAHLDIAGPGRSTSDDAELTKGGTAFSTRLLLRWLSAA